MPFPPSKNSPPQQAPQQAPAQGSPGQSAPPATQQQTPAQHGDLKPNDAHQGGNTHQANGHATPAQQSQHQAAINQNHGAGTGAPQSGGSNDCDD